MTAFGAGGKADGPSETGRGAVLGWMSFDFAAQPFFTVVLTFVFGPWFASKLAPDPATGQTAWAVTAAVSGLILAILAPLGGALADRWASRKRPLAALAVLKMAALAALWFTEPGSSLLLAGALVVVATVAAELSIVLNDAMLPGLVAPERAGLVSNLAWGLGYAGGLLALAFVLAFLSAAPETGLTLAGLPPLFGLDPARGEDARATAPLAALWYAVFVLPMFLLVPGRPGGRPAAAAGLRAGLAAIRDTLAALRERPNLARFLLARMVYADGINGLLVLGGAFAASLFGWSVAESGAFGILLNLAAIAGCGLAGLADRRFGSRAVVVAALGLLVVATLGLVSTAPGSTLFGLLTLDASPAAAGLFATPAEKAVLLFGALVGLAFGPAQASSRALLARTVSAGEAGRWFGLYALVGRATAFLAPFCVAALTALAARLTDPSTAARIGMAALIAFLLAGLLLLLRVREPRRVGVIGAPS